MEIDGRTRALMPSYQRPEPRRAEVLCHRRAPLTANPSEGREPPRASSHYATAGPSQRALDTPCDDPSARRGRIVTRKDYDPSARLRDGGIGDDVRKAVFTRG